jgi:RND family efflux transporter MFP subunit
MARRKWSEFLRYLQQLDGSQNAGGLSDAELLERYVRFRDEAAFELLVWRHGVLVFNVCRRVLSCEQDAEDAFQATFLAFVRKAHSITRRGSVAAWLARVAYRVALEARAQAKKISEKEKSGGEQLAVQAPTDPVWSDQRVLLDEEVNRLPERLRRPFVLCHLEGKSNEEAARELGCRLGTIYSRLSRGRELLRNRLVRRGVTLSIAALTSALAEHVAGAVPSVVLVRGVARMASAFVAIPSDAGISPRVASLAEGVLRTMFMTKLKIVAAMLLVVGLAAGVLTRGLTASPQAGPRPVAHEAKPEDDRKEEAKPIAVRAVKAKQGGSPLMVTRTAEVVAAQQQQVVPLVSGTVAEVLVDIGDHVKKGQTLIVLEAPLLTKEGEQAGYAYKMAQAEEDEAKARLVMAEAELEASKALLQVKTGEIAVVNADSARWETEVRRLQKEVERGVVDPQVLQESQNQLKLARAKEKAAEAATAPAKADINIKKGKLMQAKTALEAARAAAGSAHAAMDKAHIQESFTQLKAAFDGVVTRRTIDPGNFVQPSDSRLLRPLLTLQRIDTLRIVVRATRADAPFIKRGMPVAVEMPDVQERALTISRFSPSLEGADHEMTVEMDVPNADNRLLPGMEGQARLPLKKTSPDSLIVPSACLFNTNAGGRALVSIVRDGKARPIDVTVSFNDLKNAEIISRDIHVSDLVIVNRRDLNDGTPVKVEQAP